MFNNCDGDSSYIFSTYFCMFNSMEKMGSITVKCSTPM